jgi:hypothetical protein
MERAIAPMKNKHHDELDADNSRFAASDFACNRPISKTTPFADISAGVGGGVPQFGGAVGVQSPSGASAARSRAYVVERAAEAFGVQRDGLHQE